LRGFWCKRRGELFVECEEVFHPLVIGVKRFLAVAAVHCLIQCGELVVKCLHFCLPPAFRSGENGGQFRLERIEKHRPDHFVLRKQAEQQPHQKHRQALLRIATRFHRVIQASQTRHRLQIHRGFGCRPLWFLAREEAEKLVVCRKVGQGQEVFVAAQLPVRMRIHSGPEIDAHSVGKSLDGAYNRAA
jgi:hypothetical protein